MGLRARFVQEAGEDGLGKFLREGSHGRVVRNLLYGRNPTTEEASLPMME